MLDEQEEYELNARLAEALAHTARSTGNTIITGRQCPLCGKTSKMPRQKPGESKQDYGTDPEFIKAVLERYGDFVCDLAASPSNAVCERYITEEMDSLSIEWASSNDGVMWLNPPFSKIGPWAKKCAEESSRMTKNSKILFLTPASVGANWFAEYVFPFSHVFSLQPRLTFVGETDPYPKDLILSVYGERVFPPGAMSFWRWK